jgi:electron transfer flavoprotein alpha subunit
MGVEKKILVIGETDTANILTSLTNELLGGARKLAGEQGGSVELLLIGADKAGPEGDVFCHGVMRLYIVAPKGITVFDIDTITSATSAICKKTNPALCLIGQTDLGRDLAPRMAARLGSGLAMDCTDVTYNPSQDCFIQTRPAYGGKAMATIASATEKLQINTVRPKSMSVLEDQTGLMGEKVVWFDESISSQTKVRLTHCESIQEEGIRLEDAKVIIAGGGGLGGAAGFDLLGALAKELDAAIGATRVPVDEKWVPHHMEIGQTGKIVSPDVYIAVGISGATQHVTGILGSGKIVAINKDPDANIFRVADYGLVADYKQALPVLIEKLK